MPLQKFLSVFPLGKVRNALQDKCYNPIQYMKKYLKNVARNSFTNDSSAHSMTMTMYTVCKAHGT